MFMPLTLADPLYCFVLVSEAIEQQHETATDLQESPFGASLPWSRISFPNRLSNPFHLFSQTLAWHSTRGAVTWSQSRVSCVWAHAQTRRCNSSFSSPQRGSPGQRGRVPSGPSPPDPNARPLCDYAPTLAFPLHRSEGWCGRRCRCLVGNL